MKVAQQPDILVYLQFSLCLSDCVSVCCSLPPNGPKLPRMVLNRLKWPKTSQQSKITQSSQQQHNTSAKHSKTPTKQPKFVQNRPEHETGPNRLKWAKTAPNPRKVAKWPAKSQNYQKWHNQTKFQKKCNFVFREIKIIGSAFSI